MNSQPQEDTSLHPIDTLIEAKWIVTVNGADDVLTHHAIAINEGRIIGIMPTEQARTTFQPKEHYHLNNHAVMPGLINTHGHAAMTLFRGLADDLPLMEWLEKHIWPAERKHVNQQFVKDGTQLAIAEMIRTGTTCFSDMYFFPDVAAETAANVGMRAQICFPVLDFPTNWASDPDEYIRKGLALFDKYGNHDYIRVAFGPHAPYTVSDEPLVKIRTLAEQQGAKIQIHLHETEFEVAEATRLTGKRPLERLNDLGLLSPALQCVHMTQIAPQDIAILRASGAHVLHCPESNLKLASGFCPVHELMENDINVALGTDGASSNNNLDMFEEMRTAALIAKPVANNACALSAHQAIRMATINGARAIGLEESIGSLEQDKSADIIAVDLNSLSHQPVYDIVSNLVYCATGKDVSHCWIGGQLHLSGGELTRLDSHKIKESAVRWAEVINSGKEED